MKALREAALVAALLALFVALSAAGAVRNSPTVDEFAHLPAGHHYLTTGDFSLYAKNPPLVKLLAALPLLALGAEPVAARLDEDSGWRPWHHGEEFMRRNAARYHGLFVAGRAVVIALGAALGLLLWQCARRLYGPGGGLATLVLFALSPDFLAHAGLVTTDLGAALFMFAAVQAFLFLLDRPGAARGALAGLALGLALLAKFTAVLLLPLLLAGLLAPSLRPPAPPGRQGAAPAWRGMAAGGAALLGTAWLVLLAGYGFPASFTALHAYRLSSGPLRALQEALPGLVLPLPPQFLAGFDAQLADTAHYGFPNYLAGSWYEGGRWYYFPVAFLVKTPLPMLAAVAAGIALWRRGERGGAGAGFTPHEVAMLAAAAWIAVGIAFRNSIQIGVRYLLPAYPFLYVLAGRLGSGPMLRRGGRRYAAALLVAGLALLAGNARVFPHYLSYFNLLAGGAGRGHRVLLDSNVDWGQDLRELASYLRARGNPPVSLAYFGHVDPGIYGISAVPLGAPGGPRLTAISAAYLMGFDYPESWSGEWRPPPLAEAARFRNRTPVARAGYSIFIYAD